jgi:hypothetical protein
VWPEVPFFYYQNVEINKLSSLTTSVTSLKLSGSKMSTNLSAAFTQLTRCYGIRSWCSIRTDIPWDAAHSCPHKVRSRVLRDSLAFGGFTPPTHNSSRWDLNDMQKNCFRPHTARCEICIRCKSTGLLRSIVTIKFQIKCRPLKIVATSSHLRFAHRNSDTELFPWLQQKPPQLAYVLLTDFKI